MKTADELFDGSNAHLLDDSAVDPLVMASPPNPGSDAALEMGCICPVLDNSRGKGNGPFWITEGCQVHDGGAKCKL